MLSKSAICHFTQNFIHFKDNIVCLKKCSRKVGISPSIKLVGRGGFMYIGYIERGSEDLMYKDITISCAWASLNQCVKIMLQP